MAASDQHTVGEVCYSPGLNVFNDGLNYADSPPRSMVIQVSVFHNQHAARCKTLSGMQWLNLEDSWKLPSPNEVYTGGHQDHLSGLWIGWFLPDFQIIDNYHTNRFCRWPSLPRGQCVSNHTPYRYHHHPFIRKAFKVIYKPGREGDTKFFALCTPDANGICQAKIVPDGARNIFFFKEWRDDTLCGSWARQSVWTTNAKVGASRIYSAMNAAINLPAHEQEHTSGSENEGCLEEIEEEEAEEQEDDEEEENEESEYAEPESGVSGSEKEKSEGDFEQEGLLESLRPSPPDFASSSESESDSSDEDEYHSNGYSSRRESQPTPKHDIKSNNLASITSKPRSYQPRQPASSRQSTYVNHNLLSRRNMNPPATADAPVGNVATNLKRSQSPMLSLSSKSKRKRRINLQLARLPDTFSRNIMLESFSKHLKSTNLAQFDALVKNIVDSAEESVRVMIAETLEEQLKGRLPVISGA
ncbi:hypothetical protein JMJ77_0011954 [Colletotrichum scovillei]|uniref:Uncharacterized protein n=1 Tax=Colletotrichum scovillei TaxID=1209932 RepID=A0A9P7QVV7_9PEZI|nr:hypothetical protein JMJ77_0011954 [Colletotrichum scovillei]KAG7046237.1 hypothetical protein JMJ78_0011303 [Colletotrichum scovillei]KAG7063586.1 hypothetical protein JMJ76_0006048 [Colletotrichum scovillei]